MILRKTIGWFVALFGLLVMLVGGWALRLFFELPFWIAFVVGFPIMLGGFRLSKGKTLW